MPRPTLTSTDPSRIKSLSYHARCLQQCGISGFLTLLFYNTISFLPPAFCLSLPWTVANDGRNGRGLGSPNTKGANTGPRCRQEFSPKVSLLLQPSQTSRGSAASISQDYSPRSQWLCPATLLIWGKQGEYFLCLPFNLVSKHSPHKKTGLGRIDLCTILHLPNGLARNCWVSQMKKGSWFLCMAGLYLIYLSLLFPSPFLSLDKTRPWPVS